MVSAANHCDMMFSPHKSFHDETPEAACATNDEDAHRFPQSSVAYAPKTGIFSAVGCRSIFASVRGMGFRFQRPGVGRFNAGRIATGHVCGAGE
jgi:hypothetical protein